eukprot:2479314-Lingulodinium_polyedra.AAC.1
MAASTAKRTPSSPPQRVNMSTCVDAKGSRQRPRARAPRTISPAASVVVTLLWQPAPPCMEVSVYG